MRGQARSCLSGSGFGIEGSAVGRREQLERFSGLLHESPDLAVTVLHVPFPLDSGELSCGERNGSRTYLAQAFGRAGTNLGRDGLRLPSRQESKGSFLF